MRRTRAALTTLLFLFFLPPIVRAELDAVQLRLLEQFDTPLRWDNVNGAPHYFSGVKPKYHVRLQRHTVCVEPGQQTSILVSPLSVVRIEGVARYLTRDDVEVWIDNGSGLSVRYPTTNSQDGDSLFVDPDCADPCIVRLVRPCAACDPVEAAVYVSRREILGEIAPYRELIPLCGQPARIKRDDEPRGRDFYPLDPCTPHRITVNGPVRFAVATFLRYPPREERLDQTYRIGVFVDDRLHKLLEFETTAEYRHQVLVDGCLQVLGRVEIGYLEIPCGEHTVEFDSTAPVYVRVLAQKCPDYTLPNLNAPALTAAAAREQRFAFGELISGWQLTPTDVRLFAPFGEREPAASDLVAWRSVRDNAYLDGGLQGYLLLRETYRQRRDAPQIRQLAEDLRGRHTFYRDLLPTNEIPHGSHRVGWFTTKRLLRVREPKCDLVISTEHVDDALDNLSSTRFVAVGDSEQRATRYVPAGNRSTTILRVGVDRSTLDQEAMLHVQFDDRPPIPMRVFPGIIAPLELFSPAQAEAGLVALKHRHPEIDSGTLGGPFAQFRQAAAFIDAAVAELMLPNDVREIRVWSSTQSDLPVALQYRVARPFRLSETQFLEMCARSDCDLSATGLHKRFGFIRPDERQLLFSEREVVNHLTSWYRRLEANARWYTAGVGPPDGDRSEVLHIPASLLVARPSEASTRSSPDETRASPDGAGASRGESKASPDEAQALFAAQQPLVAIEVWNKILTTTSDPLERRKALLGRIDCLAVLGEEFLRERQLRGLFLFDRDPEVQAEAGSRLRKLYEEQNNLDLLTAWLATSILHSLSPEPELVEVLCDVFLMNGLTEESLLTALMLPPDRRPLDTVMSAACELRWWKTFDVHFELMTNPQQRAFWQAQRAIDLGDYEAAATAFEAGGEHGQLHGRHLAEGLDIAAGLASSDAVVRANSVLRWEQWQATHPGPRVWREDATAVSGSAGTGIVRAIEHDSHATFYRATAREPVRLSVLGPVRLKLELRPVHPSGSEEPINDWVRVRSEQRLWPVAVVDNMPSEGLEISGDPLHVVGSRIDQEIELSPGRHDLSIAPGVADLFVRVHVLRPLTPLPVLPVLTSDALHSVLAETWGLTFPIDATRDASLVYILRPDRGDFLAELPRSLPMYGRDKFLAAESPSLPKPLAVRMALRTGESLDFASVAELEEAGEAIDGDVAELLLLEERAAIRSETLVSARVPDAELPEEFKLPLLLARKKWREALEHRADDSPASIFRRLTVLLYVKETVPELAQRSRVLGESWMASHPQAAGIQAFCRRLTFQIGWIRWMEVAESAGVRRVPGTGKEPESPRQRVRAALLAPLADGEHRIYGDEVFVLRLKNSTPIRVEMTLRLEHLDHLPTAPVRVIWDVDGAQPTILDVSPQAEKGDIPKIIDTRLDPGSHFLRVRLMSPAANQYLRLELREASDRAQPPVYQPLARVMERDWSVATSDRPVRFTVKGPAWLRIDELRGERVWTRYELVEDSPREFTLSPESGEHQRLVRIFMRTANPDDEERPPLHVLHHPIPVPQSLVLRYRHSVADGGLIVQGHTPFNDPDEVFSPDLFANLDASRPPSPITVTDEYPLGGQEDGTWAVSESYINRRPLEQGITGGAQDIFYQSMATHMSYDEVNRNYWSTDLMFRERIHGNQSYGARNLISHHAEWIPVTLISQSSAFVQNPGNAIPPAQDRTEYSLNWQGEILQRRDINEQWYHTPSAMVFARYLSMNQEIYPAGYIDQDIFTPFRATHRRGIVLNDTLAWQPTLDTVLWMRGSLFTTEDFNLIQPDHVNLRWGWRQLVGYADFEATYKLTRFFANDTRANAVTQHLVDLDLVYDIWARERHRGDLSLYVQHDILKNASTIGAAITLYLDNGRGFRDFTPYNIRFNSQRRLREAVHANNQMWQTP